MSDYHILAQDVEEKTINVVFHISVPSAGVNSAGILWRDAVLKEQNNLIREDGSPVIICSRIKDISIAENTGLKNGSLIERIETVRFSRLGLSSTEKKTEIEAKCKQVRANLILQKQNTLQWIGFEGNVI